MRLIGQYNLYQDLKGLITLDPGYVNSVAKECLNKTNDNIFENLKEMNKFLEKLTTTIYPNVHNCM